MKQLLKRFFILSKGYFKQNKGNTLNFIEWTTWERVWLLLSTIAIATASILTWDNTNSIGSIAALISSITGIWCVVLVAKRKISNYIWGFFNVVFYTYAAYTWKLYGDFMLNTFYFLPMQFVGWYLWVKPSNKEDRSKVKSFFLSWKSRIIWILIMSTSTIGYGFILKRMGGETPFFDAMSTVGSVIAMILMAKAFMEQWVLWVIVDIVTVIMWVNICFVQKGLFNLGILIMWVAWLINAVYGLYIWIKDHKGQKV